MTHKNFAAVAGVVFSIVAIAHALRFLFAWPVVIANFSVPVWCSALAAVVAGYLALQGFRLKK